MIDAFTVDTANGPNYRNDCGLYGHGTPVASLVGGATWGVAKGVTLMNVKIVGPNYLGVEHAIAGFDFVIGEHLASPGVPKVINFSQAYAPSDLLDAKIREAISLKIPVVVGAGNEGADPCNRDPGHVSQAYRGTPYTAANPSQYSVIAVGGSELINNYSQDQRYISSNYGACLDIFAPGAGVSALSKSGTRRAHNGTSMAAPLVTGAVARHLKNYIGYSPFPSADGIENELKSMATVPSPAYPTSGLAEPPAVHVQRALPLGVTLIEQKEDRQDCLSSTSGHRPAWFLGSSEFLGVPVPEERRGTIAFQA